MLNQSEEQQRPDCIISSIVIDTYHNANVDYKYIYNIIDFAHDILNDSGNLCLHLSDAYKYNDNQFAGLMGIPYRIMNHILDCGYIIKNVIVWHKKNISVNYVMQRSPVDYDLIILIAKSNNSYFHNQFERHNEYLTYKRKTESDKATIIERKMNDIDRAQLLYLKNKFIDAYQSYISPDIHERLLKEFSILYKEWFEKTSLVLPTKKELEKLNKILNVDIKDFLHDNTTLLSIENHREIFIRSGRSKRSIWSFTPDSNNVMPKDLIKDLLFITCPPKGIVIDIFGNDVKNLQAVCEDIDRNFINFVFKGAKNDNE